jgi:hypothetical protein
MRILLTIFCLIVLLSTVADTKIVFSSKRDGISGIYVMNDDGSNVTLQTDKLSSNYPRWSPDRMQVNPPENREYNLFLMNASGTNVHPLTEQHAGIDNEHKMSMPKPRSSKHLCPYSAIGNVEDSRIFVSPTIIRTWTKLTRVALNSRYTTNTRSESSRV